MSGDFLSVLAAGIAAALIGWLWYSPKMFGGVWMRMGNMTPEQMERGKKRMPLYAIIALIAAMLVAWVMTYVGNAFFPYGLDWLAAVEVGFWCWLGFCAPPMLGMVLWEQKPIRYYLIVAGYWLVAFIVMALILVAGSQILNGGYTSSTTDTSGSSYGE